MECLRERCRACLDNMGTVSIFNTKSLLRKLQACTSIKISSNDCLPQKLCTECTKVLHKAYSFKKKCELNDKHLQNIVTIREAEIKKEPSSDKNEVDYGDTEIENIKAESDEYAEIKNEDYIYECDICKSTFNDFKMLEKHITKHSKEKYYCYVCKSTFMGSKEIQSHKNSCEKVKYPCEYCAKEFYLNNLNAHIQAVHDRVVMTCSLCHKLYRNQQMLKNHMKQVHERKTLQCPQCPRTFQTRSVYFEHVKRHSDQRAYPCSYCAKAFKYFSDRKQHERIHTGERPFRCPLCPCGFTQCSNMKSHIRKRHKGFDMEEVMELYRNNKSEKKVCVE